jgi:hypothetical protein
MYGIQGKRNIYLDLLCARQDAGKFSLQFFSDVSGFNDFSK